MSCNCDLLDAGGHARHSAEVASRLGCGIGVTNQYPTSGPVRSMDDLAANAFKFDEEIAGFLVLTSTECRWDTVPVGP